ncbi:MAG: SCO family protein, partial [Planctomycetota bacterium]|nr:SCO family protein [Planctomycetota bacterium]
MRFPRRSGWLALVTAVLLVACGCPDDPAPGPSPDPKSGKDSETTTGDVDNARPTRTLLTLDLPLPEFRLIDSTGQEFGSRELAGHPYVVNFIFTRCQLTCPEQTRRMAEFQKRVARKIED